MRHEKILTAPSLRPLLLVVAALLLGTLAAHYTACIGWNRCEVENRICEPWMPDCQ
jgi:hypothetical protein